MGCVESVPVNQQAHHRRPAGGRIHQAPSPCPACKKPTPRRHHAKKPATARKAPQSKNSKKEQEKTKRVQAQKRNPQFEQRKQAAIDAAIEQEKKQRGIPSAPPANALSRDIREYRTKAATLNNSTAETAAPQDPEEFRRQVEELIPAEVIMISGCEDEQTSADVANAGNKLPDPKGRAGGAATSNLLSLLYEHKNENFTFQDTLMALRDKLQDEGMSQVPQMTSSRPLDIDEKPFSFHNGGEGQKRAVLVGINYRGQNGELRGCHNDAYHMRDYLIKEQGFSVENITVLTDDGNGVQPTKQKMILALKDMVDISQAGDSVFFHYSGHGGFLEADQNSLKQKNDEYDQTLIPLDHQQAGQIRDFNLFNHFVRPMKKGVNVTCLIDSCHSGSVLDLPYSYKPTSEGKGSAYGQSMSIADIAGIAFLAILAGEVLDDLLFGSCFDYYDCMGFDWMIYQGMYEDMLVNDLLLDGLVEDQISQAVEEQVEAEMTREIEREIERELEAEIAREIELEVQRELEREVQRELELEMEREIQREMERELENAFMDDMW